MADRVSVLLAMRGAEEEALLREAHRSGRVRITRRCADTSEVLAAALAGVGDVAVVDHLLGVTRSFIQRLRGAGITAVVVAPSSQHEVLEAMGARALDVAAGDLLAALEAVLEEPEAVEPLADAPPPSPPRDVIAVMSAWGSPGRTTVAVNLAAELAARGGNTLLIDADLWGASVKQYLGLDPDGAGLAAAVRAVERGTFDREGLDRLTEESHGMHILGGLNKSDRWREVSGPGLGTLWEVIHTWPGNVVIDAPLRLPAAEEGPGHFGPDPNSMWESVHGAATEVCLVAGADTVGVHRFVNLYLDEAAERPHVVVNRVRGSAGGPQAKESIHELLSRFAGITDPILLDDDDAVDRAVLEGVPVRVLAPKSPVLKGLEELAERIAPQRKRARRQSRFGLRRRNGAD